MENYLTHKTTVEFCINKNTSQPISTFAKIGPTIAQSILPTIITIWVTCFLAQCIPRMNFFAKYITFEQICAQA
jgi:hypothetical protein